MIVGFDHLALSTTNIEEAEHSLLKKGYTSLFIEQHIPNSPLKKKLLHQYQPYHDIGFFSMDQKIPIEVIFHGDITDGNPGPFSIHSNAICLKTQDMELERAFWIKGLGFISDCGLNSLQLNSPVPNWNVSLDLIADTNTMECTLDSPGYTCLALYSSNLPEDLCKIMDLGARDIIGPFDFHVNNKNLQILMFRTPGGAICELIQPKRG